jgi:hypothetical protein
MLRQYLKSLADKFRTYLGSEPNDLINAQDFPSAIDDVYEAGKQSVDTTEAFENGKKAQYDEFWDNFQDYGKREFYNYGFASHFGWNATNLKPKYDVKPVEANYLFYGFRFPSLKPFFDDRGIQLDFSNCRNMSFAFIASNLTELGVIDLKNAGTSTSSMCSGCSKLVTIKKMVVYANNVVATSTFSGCTNLENIIIEGVIGKNFDMSPCTKLSHDSLMSIINHLEAKTSGTFTLSIGSTNLAKLTDAEKAIATQKGWTLA